MDLRSSRPDPVMRTASRRRPPVGEASFDVSALLQQLPAVVYVAEPGDDGDWLYVSPQIESILGFTPDEWLSHPAPFATFVHPEDLPFLQALEARAVASPGQSYVEEFRIATKNGDERRMSGRSLAVRSPSGEILLQGLLMDVTGARTALELLRDASARYRAVFDASPLAIMTWDREGRILSWNPAAERMFGWTAQEAIGRFHPQVPEDAKEEMLGYIERGFRGERWEDLELVRRCKDGTLLDVQISSDTIRDENGNVVAMMSIIGDLTERKRAERLVRAQELELRQREQLDAIGKLAGGIAHDFNNLLTAIHGQALLALGALGPDDALAANVAPIVDAAERASALTRQLLAFGRRQVLEPRVLSLNAVVTSIEPLLHRLAGEGIAVRTRLAPDVPAIEADPTQIDQVLVNLVTNARDAMPRGGSIEIVTGTTELERPGETGRRYSLLRVSDDGEGMDEVVRARAFEPFFTTKETGKGSGLGLSTVYGIVAQSGGHVELESEPGRGATLAVYLPAVDRPLSDAPVALPRQEASHGEARVLLVEDEPLVRELAERVLRLEGYRVESVATAAEVVERIDPTAFDLLVSDVVMPGMSGPDLALELRARHPGLAVLFISGYNEAAITGYGAQGQTVELLQKPFTPATLAARVRAVLDGAPRP